MTKKRIPKMRKAEQEAAIAEYVAFCLKNRNEKNDSGAYGKAAEPLARSYVNERLNEGDTKARTMTKADCRFKDADKKMKSLELKTGCGALAYDYIEEAINLNEMLPKVDYIAYNPEFYPNMPIEKQFFVFTREEFLEMLTGYNPGKPFTWFRINKSRKQVNIQEFTTSKKKIQYLFDELYERPTLEEFMTGVKAAR